MQCASLRLLGLAALVALANACAAAVGPGYDSDGDGGAGADAVADARASDAPQPLCGTTLVVSPATSNLAPGSRLPFVAILTSAGGLGCTPPRDRDVSDQVTWTSSNPGAATIDGAGIATGVGLGTTTIAASYEGQTSNAATLTTTADGAPVSVHLFVDGASAPTSETHRRVLECFRVRGRMTLPDGTTRDVTPDDGVTWSSSNGAVATVNWEGLVCPGAPGTSVIAVSLGGYTWAQLTLVVD